MIMRPGQQLLLPANTLFIWTSLLMALLLNMVQNMGLWGRAAWAPDMLALVLVFWSVHQPLRVGIGIAFAFGLMMDVHQSSLLGQHALAYTALSFLAIAIHRRLLWFSVPSQALPHHRVVGSHDGRRWFSGFFAFSGTCDRGAAVASGQRGALVAATAGSKPGRQQTPVT